VDAFNVEGEMTVFANRSFCPKCGSRIAWIRDDEVDVHLGTLDKAPADIVPQYEIWTPRRESWMMALPWADQFQNDRTDGGGDWRTRFVES
jgi:hypothetical protein